MTGQDGPIATLLLLNGPPGVGKSTLARRYLGQHPEARAVEVDRLRTLLPGWETDLSTQLTARDLALGAVAESLHDDLDVIVPQYLGRTGFIEQLADAAAMAGARFAEAVLWDDEAAVAARFAQRRARLRAEGTRHPEADVSDVDAAVADACARLREVAAARPGTIALAMADGEAALLARVGELLRST